MKTWKPIFIENSVVPKILSYVSPIKIGAISLGIFVFCRGECHPALRRHETIHFQQQLELFFVGFYVLYLLFWLVLLLKHRKGDFAYEEIPFEREARYNQYSASYLTDRKRFSWIKYMRDIF